MKNKISLFLVISAFLIFTGCSKNVPVNSGIVRTSEPLHIMEFPQDKLISVNFTNTSTTDSNLTQAVIQHLRADGFKVVNKGAANVQIGGNLNYFRKADFSRRSWDNPRFSFGMGFGRYYRYTGVGAALPRFWLFSKALNSAKTPVYKNAKISMEVKRASHTQ